MCCMYVFAEWKLSHKDFSFDHFAADNRKKKPRQRKYELEYDVFDQKQEHGPRISQQLAFVAYQFLSTGGIFQHICLLLKHSVTYAGYVNFLMSILLLIQLFRFILTFYIMVDQHLRSSSIPASRYGWDVNEF